MAELSIIKFETTNGIVCFTLDDIVRITLHDDVSLGVTLNNGSHNFVEVLNPKEKFDELVQVLANDRKHTFVYLKKNESNGAYYDRGFEVLARLKYISLVEYYFDRDNDMYELVVSSDDGESIFSSNYTNFSYAQFFYESIIKAHNTKAVIDGAPPLLLSGETLNHLVLKAFAPPYRVEVTKDYVSVRNNTTEKRFDRKDQFEECMFFFNQIGLQGIDLKEI